MTEATPSAPATNPAFSRRALLGAGIGLPFAGLLIGWAPSRATASVGVFDPSDTLSEGDSGDDVLALQMRLAGYPSSSSVLAIDGEYGPATAAAVERFQNEYSLDATGNANSETLSQIESMQDSDGWPEHFPYSEWNLYNVDLDGLNYVDRETALFNGFVTMWKMEAVRRTAGDLPLSISSTVRNSPGTEGSRHFFGDAVDIGSIDGTSVLSIGNASPVTTVAQAGADHGFRNILGPGFDDDHANHIHFSEYLARDAYSDTAGTPGSSLAYAGGAGFSQSGEDLGTWTTS